MRWAIPKAAMVRYRLTPEPQELPARIPNEFKTSICYSPVWIYNRKIGDKKAEKVNQVSNPSHSKKGGIPIRDDHLSL